MIFLSWTLSELYLHWNLISAYGFSQIIRQMMENQTMRVLDLSSNKIGKGFGRNEAETFSTFLSRNTYLVHLDLSQNYIPPKYFKTISKGFEKNQTIIGMHIRGNFGGAYIDPLGYMKRNKERSFFYAIQDQQNKRRIDGIRRVSDEYDNHANQCFKNCWICEGWSCQEFSLEDPSLQISLHLDFLDFEPLKMTKIDSEWVCSVMCPPKKILFFFSNQAKNVILDQNEKTEKCSISYKFKTKRGNKTVESEQVVLNQANMFYVFPSQSIFQPNYSKLIKIKPRRSPPKSFEYSYREEDIGEYLNRIEQQDYLIKRNDKFFDHLIQNLLLKLDFARINLKKLKKAVKKRQSFYFKNQDEFKEKEVIEDMLKEQIPKLHKTFRHYSGKAAIDPKQDSYWFLTLEQFKQLFVDCGEVIDAYEDGFNDSVFDSIVQDYLKRKGSSEKQIIDFEDFLNLLLEIAISKFLERRRAKSLSQALQMLLEQAGVLKLANKILDPVAWRQKTFVSKEIIFLIGFYQDSLLDFYSKFLGYPSLDHPLNSKYKDCLVLNQAGFNKVCGELNLIEYSVTLHKRRQLTEEERAKIENDEEGSKRAVFEEINLCFANSIRNKVYGSGLDNVPLMLFTEFIEALIRLSEKFHLPHLVN